MQGMDSAIWWIIPWFFYFPSAEGARRSALMTLRHDFDLHYKYTGKV